LEIFPVDEAKKRAGFGSRPPLPDNGYNGSRLRCSLVGETSWLSVGVDPPRPRPQTQGNEGGGRLERLIGSEENKGKETGSLWVRSPPASPTPFVPPEGRVGRGEPSRVRVSTAPPPVVPAQKGWLPLGPEASPWVRSTSCRSVARRRTSWWARSTWWRQAGMR